MKETRNNIYTNESDSAFALASLHWNLGATDVAALMIPELHPATQVALRSMEKSWRQTLERKNAKSAAKRRLVHEQGQFEASTTHLKMYPGIYNK